MVECIPYIKAVGRGEKLKRDLSYEESREALRLILTRTATDAQIGAFLIAQRVKGEAVDEINGFVDLLRSEFVIPLAPRVDNLVDLVAPYDGKAKTAQLAPAIALTLAAAGLPVLLHGAADIPTKVGVTVAQVLAGLGFDADMSIAAAERSVESRGFGYIDARHFAPAYDALTPLRHQFGLRTVLNTVEKLLNPANAVYQISGFFHANYIERIRMTQTGARASWMVQGEEGSIELATGRRSHIYAEDPAHDRILGTEEFGSCERIRIALPPVVADHVQLNREVLDGVQGPALEQVALSAGVFLSLVGAVEGIDSGCARAKELLKSGRAREVAGIS